MALRRNGLRYPQQAQRRGEGQTPKQAWRKPEQKNGVRVGSGLGHREVTAKALRRLSQVEPERIIVCDVNGETRGPPQLVFLRCHPLDLSLRITCV